MKEDICSDDWCDREAEYTFDDTGYCKQHFNLSTVNDAVDQAEVAITHWAAHWTSAVGWILDALDKIDWKK